MKREVRKFLRMFRDMDWFEWFILLIVVFVSVLFWIVLDELRREFGA